jgi:hypothetical protein
MPSATSGGVPALRFFDENSAPYEIADSVIEVARQRRTGLQEAQKLLTTFGSASAATFMAAMLDRLGAAHPERKLR